MKRHTVILGLVLLVIFMASYLTLTLRDLGTTRKVSDHEDNSALLQLAQTGDAVAMYQLGISSLDANHVMEGYVWYKLALAHVKPWTEAAKGKRGEEPFNTKYLVKDIFKIQDEVKTAIPLLESRLSAAQKERAAQEIETRRLAIERHTLTDNTLPRPGSE